MHRWIYFIVNGITLYRLVAAFILLYLLVTNQQNLFKWLLPLSFFTDAIDGFLARRYNAVSLFGSKLDSVADQFTVLAAIAGLFVFKSHFIRENQLLIAIVLALYAGQTVLALIRYHRISSFHTVLAKLAGLLCGAFFILIFLTPEPVYFLFYLAVFITILELLEEIILVLLLPQWQTDVKGLYWVLQQKREEH